MRIITKKAVNALYSFRNFCSGNTRVVVINAGTEATLYLHGNAIANLAKQDDGTLDLEITTAGWNKRTTFEHLNGLPGVRVNQKDFSVYLNGAAWDGAWITVETPDSKASPYDLGQAMLRYEEGELDHDAIIEFFQHLLKSGIINQLQGSYGRTAHHLIAEGLISIS